MLFQNSVIILLEKAIATEWLTRCEKNLPRPFKVQGRFFYVIDKSNSFDGLKREIEQLDIDFDYVIMFGIDKTLNNMVRIECVAEIESYMLLSELDLKSISERLSAVGIENYLSDKPTHYLCNEAYWMALRKFKGKVVFIHIPSIKSISDEFLMKMKLALV